MFGAACNLLVRTGVVSLLALTGVSKLTSSPLSWSAVVAVGELLLALWCVSRYASYFCWLVVMLTFAAFSVINLVTMSRGGISCGCFGTLSMPPSTMFLIDASLLLAVWGVRHLWCKMEHNRSARVRSVGVVVAVFCGGVFVASSSDVSLVVNQAVLDKEIVKLGQSLEPPVDISSGVWKVWIVKTGCPKCAARINELAEGVNDRTLLIDIGSAATGERWPALLIKKGVTVRLGQRRVLSDGLQLPIGLVVVGGQTIEYIEQH